MNNYPPDISTYEHEKSINDFDEATYEDGVVSSCCGAEVLADQERCSKCKEHCGAERVTACASCKEPTTNTGSFCTDCEVGMHPPFPETETLEARASDETLARLRSEL